MTLQDETPCGKARGHVRGAQWYHASRALDGDTRLHRAYLPVQEEAMTQDAHHFAQFMKQREQAAQAFVSGDGAPVARIATQTNPATFFGPGGGHEDGAKHVSHLHQEGAKQFGPDGKSKLEILHQGASEGIAYWVGIQHATVGMQDKPEPIQMDLRVTEIFRFENDQWKLIHRHADPLAQAKK
jgi:Domain of unknown function (DUF4440)